MNIKRFVAKGYVKVKKAQRRKLRYIITPEGIAFRARLTVHYIETSMRLYRRIRARVRELLGEVQLAGYSEIQIEGEGDIADICRLTCLEQNIRVLDGKYQSSQINVPTLEIHGTKVRLRMEEE